MNIRVKVLEKIKKESKKHAFSEFGGMLEIRSSYISDIHFPKYKHQSGAYIKFNMNDIMDLDSDIQSKIGGWFHRHPITGLSIDDIDTINTLTKFWRKCYTLVWQSNGVLKLWRTTMRKGIDGDYVNIDSVQEYYLGTWMPEQDTLPKLESTEVIDIGYI